MVYIKRFYIVLFCTILVAVSVFSIYFSSGHRQPVNGNTVLSGCTVVIDPGHGGKDAGTIGIDGTQEKIINLAVSLKLYDYLSVCGYHTVMTRSDDTEVYPENSDRSRSDLYNRLDFINAQDNAVLVSVHQNHFSDEREWGTQIWYSANTPESKVIADSVLTYTKQYLQPDNHRENKQSDDSYYLLYQATAPSIMVECGFMSNRAENEKLQSEEYQNQLACAIMLGLCKEL